MRLLAALAAAGAAAVVGPASGWAATQHVDVQFDAFAPTPLDVLPGETVTWKNVGQRTHTVTAGAGTLDSGDIDPGASFARTFPSVGGYAYYCTLHPEMTGEIDVRRVILGPLPTAAVLSGSRVEFSGRTADGSRAVAIQGDTGHGFRTVGSARPGADGRWAVTLPVRATGRYRASVGADRSELRRLLVNDRRIRLRATRRGVAVTVTPDDPYAQIRLEQYRRERLGWWPEPAVRLDYVSSAELTVRRPARVRVVLVAQDGWTPVASSRALTLRPLRGHGG